MYRFEDAGGREVGLRYDLTVPLARVVAMHQNELVLPFKRYHIAPVWRAENPQRGRFREFWQCDADIAGSSSPLADAEVIASWREALEAIGIPEFTIRISHRRLLESSARRRRAPEQATRLSRHRQARQDRPRGRRRGTCGRGADGDAGGAGARPRDETGRTAEPVDELRRDLSGVEGAVRRSTSWSRSSRRCPHLASLPNRVQPRSGAGARPRLLHRSRLRGDRDRAEGRLGRRRRPLRRAGRRRSSGAPIPATGMSLGLERIIEVVREHGLCRRQPASPRSRSSSSPRRSPPLRGWRPRSAQQGLRVDLSLQPNRSVGDQLKLADRRGIPTAVILGPEEANAGSVT